MESNSPEPAPESPFVVIGIDYGTTYSGAAWARSGALTQIEVISQWSSQTPGAANSEKVPSDISYDEDGIPAKWGFGLTNNDDLLRWTKLLLTRRSLDNMSSSNEQVLDATRKRLIELGLSGVDAIADYLRFLWKHILERLRVRLTQAVLDNMIFKIVLTVPAIWDHRAQEYMITAAKRAGLLKRRSCGVTELTLIAEPAAAALATYIDAGLDSNPTIELGDSFVVCDAGGGTVDLISYTIDSFSPFKLSECVAATGDLCGAIYVDRAFENHVDINRKYMRTVSVESRKRFMEKEWEKNIKRNFDGSNGPWVVELPVAQASKRASGIFKSMFSKPVPNILELEGGHLESMFDQVVPKIIDLLRDQIADIKRKSGSPPKVIVLVGGFGENRYLLQRLEHRFHDIVIQQPVRAWSAVCRGAVYTGIHAGNQIVSNHISKYFYGCVFSADWDDEKYSLEDKNFDDKSQKWMAKGQIEWYLKKHDDVQQLKSAKYNFTQLFNNRKELENASFEIISSDYDDPGTRISSKVQPLCSIHLQFESDQFGSFPIHTNAKGRTFRRVNSTLEMMVTVSSVKWVVTCNGKVIPTKIDYYENDPASRLPT